MPFVGMPFLDGPSIRSANRADSHESIRANRFAKNKAIFTTFERFARIAPNLRFASVSAKKRVQLHGGALKRVKRFARIRRCARIDSRDFRVDGAKSPDIPQKEGILGPEIAARNRKSLATFHRTLKSQCSIAFDLLSRGSLAISGVRDGHRNCKSQKSLPFWCAKLFVFQV